MLPDVSHHLLVGPAVCVAAVVFNELICAVTGLAVLAVHQRVGESAYVAGSHPCLRVHQDSGVQSYIVLVLLNELLAPRVLDVGLELNAEGAVVPCVSESAVDLTAGVNEASALAEGNDFVEGLFCVVHV